MQTLEKLAITASDSLVVIPLCFKRDHLFLVSLKLFGLCSHQRKNFKTHAASVFPYTFASKRDQRNAKTIHEQNSLFRQKYSCLVHILCHDIIIVSLQGAI